MLSRSSISCLLTTTQMFLGSSSGVVMEGCRILCERESFLLATTFSQSVSHAGCMVVCCLNAPQSLERHLMRKKAYMVLTVHKNYFQLPSFAWPPTYYMRGI